MADLGVSRMTTLHIVKDPNARRPEAAHVGLPTFCGEISGWDVGCPDDVCKCRHCAKKVQLCKNCGKMWEEKWQQPSIS